MTVFVFRLPNKQERHTELKEKYRKEIFKDYFFNLILFLLLFFVLGSHSGITLHSEIAPSRGTIWTAGH